MIAAELWTVVVDMEEKSNACKVEVAATELFKKYFTVRLWMVVGGVVTVLDILVKIDESSIICKVVDTTVLVKE